MSETEIEDLYNNVVNNLEQYDYYLQLRRDNKIVDSQNNVYDISAFICILYNNLDRFGLMLDEEKKVMEKYGVDEYKPFLDVYKNRSNLSKKKIKSISLTDIENNLIPKKIQIIDKFIVLEKRNLEINNYLNSENVKYYDGLLRLKNLLFSSELQIYHIKKIVNKFLINYTNFLSDVQKNEIKSFLEKYNNDGDDLTKKKLFGNILKYLANFDKDYSRTNLFETCIKTVYNNNSEYQYVVKNILIDYLKQNNLQDVFDKLRKSKKIKIFTDGLSRYYCINKDFLNIIDSEIDCLNIDSKKLLDLRKEKQQNENELKSLRNNGYNCSSDLAVLYNQKCQLEKYQSFAHNCLQLIPKNEHTLKTVGNRLYPLSGQVNTYKKEFIDILIGNSKKDLLSIDNNFVNGNISMDDYISTVKKIFISSIRNFCNLSMLSIVGKGQKIIDDSNKNSEAYINEFLVYMNDFTDKLSKIHLKHEDELKEKIGESLDISNRRVKTKNPIKKISVFFKSLNKKKLKSQRISLIGKVVFDTMINNNINFENVEFYRSITNLLENNYSDINIIVDKSSKIK